MDIKEEEEDKKKGFIDYVFNFNRENMDNISNLWQYTFIAIPLVLICLKLLNYLSPEADDTKGSLEIIFEIFISINVLLLTIWFVNKIIRYIPTRSKALYHSFNEINFILPFLILLFTIDTKLGNKINILIDRAYDLYNGNTNLNAQTKNAQNKNDVKTMQPISRGGGGGGANVNNGINQQQPMLANTIALNNPQLYQQNNNTAPEMNFNTAFSGPNINNLLQIEEPMPANEFLTSRF
jgi:hypothetical protein